MVECCKFITSRPGVFLGKGVLKICSKFTGEHPFRSVISIKLQSNFTEIALRHGCSPANLLHIFITPFPMNTILGGCFIKLSTLTYSVERYQSNPRPHFKIIIPPIIRIPPPHFLKSEVFLINRNACNCETKFNKNYPCTTTTERWLFYLHVHSNVHAR